MSDFYKNEVNEFLKQKKSENSKLIELGRLTVAMERDEISIQQFEKLKDLLSLSEEQIDMWKEIPGYEYQE